MDANRSDDAMTDSAGDRELQRWLAVDPSPEFVARVRTRIASQPRPSASWLSWQFVAVAAMAVMVVLGVVIRRSREPTTIVPASIAQAVRPADTVKSTGQSGTAAQAHAPVPPTRSTVDRISRPHRATVTPATTIEPEILIDMRDAQAIRAFIDGARDGRIDVTPSVFAPSLQVMEAEPVPEISFAPIKIEPLTAGNGEKGVPQ